MLGAPQKRFSTRALSSQLGADAAFLKKSVLEAKFAIDEGFLVPAAMCGQVKYEIVGTCMGFSVWREGRSQSGLVARTNSLMMSPNTENGQDSMRKAGRRAPDKDEDKDEGKDLQEDMSHDL